MQQLQPRFRDGDKVQARNDRTMIGSVRGDPVMQGGLLWYRITLPNGQIKRMPESGLVSFHPVTTPESLFSSGSFGDEDDLLRLVTFQKLDTPLENTLYSMFASRTEFFPHQYKPLIKFLDSRTQRLLIADEVGLGKTIEAGIIMVEQRARSSLDSMLIVCPSALREKWSEEMWRRFDEEFHILNRKGFEKLYADYATRGRITPARVIVSVETLRQSTIREMLETQPLSWDLIVVDEAHHFRNPSAQGYKAAQDICEPAHAVLLLTATPIHLGEENLLHLLHLLDSDEFNDSFGFNQRLRANEPVVEAQRILSAGYPPDVSALRERVSSLASAGLASFYTGNPLAQRVKRTVSASDFPSRESVALMSQDLKDLNLLGHIFTRSRKREVIESKVVRTAHVIRVEMRAEEERFYRAVTAFARSHGPGEYFAAVTAQRQVASCMQAARVPFMEKALEALDDPDVEPDLDLDDTGATKLNPSLEVMEAARGLGGVDTKLQRLIEELRRIEELESGRHILLFSFFRGTLAYLNRRLREAGFTCDVLHGGVKSDPTGRDDQRGAVIRRFREGKFQILLSSEVGSEGLDFQFCHVLINYDLPWNPMRIEQRIGRLDRLGQKSDRIVIINLSLAGTIEDRILTRLYDRIGIFEQSIGDLEAILGDEIESLTRDLLSRSLTEEEENKLIDSRLQVIEARKVQLEQIESNASRFLGADQVFDDMLKRARFGGETLAPRDLEAYVRRFLESGHSDSSVEPANNGTFVMNAGGSLETAIRTLPDSHSRTRLLHRIWAGDGKVSVVFDPQAARGMDDAELITGKHPVLELATSYFRDRPETLHAVSAIHVERASGVAPGTYMYLLEGIEITGGRQRRRLEPFFVRQSDLEPLDEEHSSTLLGAMLRTGSRWSQPPHPEAENAESVLLDADASFCARLANRRSETLEREQALLSNRLASIEASHSNRIGQLNARIASARSQGGRETYIRLIEAQIRKQEARFQQQTNDLERDAQLEMQSSIVGCGYVMVAGA